MAMMDATGCDGVVVGRGCLGRPWLFAELAAAHRGGTRRHRADASAGSARRCSSTSTSWRRGRARPTRSATSASTPAGTSPATRWGRRSGRRCRRCRRGQQLVGVVDVVRSGDGGHGQRAPRPARPLTGPASRRASPRLVRDRGLRGRARRRGRIRLVRWLTPPAGPRVGLTAAARAPGHGGPARSTSSSPTWTRRPGAASPPTSTWRDSRSAKARAACVDQPDRRRAAGRRRRRHRRGAGRRHPRQADRSRRCDGHAAATLGATPRRPDRRRDRVRRRGGRPGHLRRSHRGPVRGAVRGADQRLRGDRRTPRQGRRVRDPGQSGDDSSAAIDGSYHNVVGLPAGPGGRRPRRDPIRNSADG